MKNTLQDLNNHLFAEIERLGDEDLKGDKLTEETQRARAVTAVASQIIQNGDLALRVLKFNDDHMSADTAIPTMLKSDK